MNEDASLRAAFDAPYGYDVEKPRELLALKPGRTQRLGNDLILTLSGAPPLILRDDITGCYDGTRRCDGYWLVADLPSRHFYLVREYYYEGGDYFLIDDRTGHKTAIGSVPIFSPDGQRFLAQDSLAQQIEIWRREGDGATLEWTSAMSPAELQEPYRSKVMSWQGNSIVLAFSIENPERHWTSNLTLSADGWHLTANWPK